MILVTGGTGLVGSHLLLELTRKYDRIRAIHRPASNKQNVLDVFSLYLKNPEEQYGKIEWVEADITDIDSILDILDGIKYVYHTAADVSFKPGDQIRLLDNNVGGTANMVNACLERKIKKFCFVSSTAALGDATRGEAITEDLAWAHSKHRSMYAISKFNSEMEVWRGIAEGLNAIIINPSIIIGPGDWSRSSPYLFTAVWNGLKFYSRGVTGYVDIRDVIHAMTFLTEGNFEGERYTVSSENLSYRKVLEMIALALGKKTPRFHAAPYLIAIGWRIDWLLSALTGKSRMITKDTAKSSNRKAEFSSAKIQEATGMQFMEIQKSINETAAYFLQTYSGKA